MSFSSSFLDDTKQNNTQISAPGNDVISQLDREIESATKEIQEYISLYSLLQRELSESREIHQKDLTKIREEIEHTKQTTLEQNDLQEQKQFFEEQQFREVSKQVLEQVAQTKSNIDTVEQPKLTTELKEAAAKDETIKLEEQLHQLELDQLREECTYVPPEPNTNKEDFQNAQNEVENLKKQLNISRDQNKNLLSSLANAHENTKLNHQESINKLKKAFDTREKEQLKHIELAKKLLESEQRYSESEKEALHRQEQTLREVREKLKQECSRRVKEAINEMKRASQALEDAEKSEMTNKDMLDTKSSMTLQDNMSLDQLKEREIRMQLEIDRLSAINQKAFQILQEQEKLSRSDDFLDSFNSD